MPEETVLLRHPDNGSTFRARVSAVEHHLRSGWERIDDADFTRRPSPAPTTEPDVAAPDVPSEIDPPTPVAGDTTEGA